MKKIEELKTKNIWFSYDNKGNIGVHDATYDEAKEDAERLAREYPDDEWTFDVQD